MAMKRSQLSGVRRYADNLQHEIDGAAIYAALAGAEADPNLSQLYGRLAAVEEEHAGFWRRKLEAAGARGPTRPSFRAKALVWLAHKMGPGVVLPIVGAGEARDSGHYDTQADAKDAGMAADERSHARLIRAAGEGRQGMAGPAVARLEGRHRGAGGNALRAAVLGANDGLVSNLSLVMGVAGAAVSEKAILLTGLAGLVAGACSMAMGEWLSVTSARELFQAQIAVEAAELEESPEEEKEELVLIYRSKGLDEAEARALADKLLSDPATALDTLAREELGIDPRDLGGSAWAAAGVSFLLFAGGAVFPVAPFAFLPGSAAVVTSLILSGVALAMVGMATSLFTGRSALFSATRQVAIGYAAALVTYGVGRLVGVSIS